MKKVLNEQKYQFEHVWDENECKETWTIRNDRIYKKNKLRKKQFKLAVNQD